MTSRGRRRNPCDLIATLVHGWPDDLQRLTPMLYGVANIREGPPRIIYGTLYWDGNPIADLGARIAHSYPEPMSWATAQTYGDNRRRDADLLGFLGLRYMFIEKVGSNMGPPTEQDAVTLWLVRDGQVHRIVRPFAQLRAAGWRGPYPVPYFFDAHHHQINALVARYRHDLGIEPSLTASVQEPVPEPDLDDAPVRVRHTHPNGKVSSWPE